MYLHWANYQLVKQDWYFQSLTPAGSVAVEADANTLQNVTSIS